jgi:glucose 1-dehydrogenase
MPDQSKKPFAGKVALITGASSGIGQAAAEILGRAGCDVAMSYLTQPHGAEKAAAAVRAAGQKALPLRVDVSDQPAVERMVEQTVKELGRIDFLVTSAVYSDREPFHTANMTGFRKTIEVSLFGAYYTLRAAAKVMIEQGQGGSIVIVSSPHAVIPFPSAMAYNIAKAGLDSMARSAATELLDHKIRVNGFHPGWTDTPGERKFFSEETIQKSGKAMPWGRLATSEEMARGIYFLLDPANDYMTGIILTMDGGLNLPFWSKRGSGDF